VARTKAFDPDTALLAARDAFWEFGYEALSTTDLCDQMNIARQSLYDTFGSKRELFLLALTQYRDETFERARSLLSEPTSAVTAIDSFLRGICASSKKQRSLGCLLLNSVSELGPADTQVVALASGNQQRVLALLTDVVRHGVFAGELDTNLDPSETAQHVLTTYYGTRVMAKIDPSLHGIDTTINHLLASISPRQ
jgi:TetR/AcrR family transcriptional regulator, transcriptional repressor for nem operon